MSRSIFRPVWSGTTARMASVRLLTVAAVAIFMAVPSVAQASRSVFTTCTNPPDNTQFTNQLDGALQAECGQRASPGAMEGTSFGVARILGNDLTDVRVSAYAFASPGDGISESSSASASMIRGEIIRILLDPGPLTVDVASIRFSIHASGSVRALGAATSRGATVGYGVSLTVFGQQSSVGGTRSVLSGGTTVEETGDWGDSFVFRPYLGTPGIFDEAVVEFQGFAQAFALGVTETGETEANFENSLTWGGIEFVDASGAVLPVSFSAIGSESGLDYSVSYIPEPSTATLLMLGLLGLSARYRRGVVPSAD